MRSRNYQFRLYRNILLFPIRSHPVTASVVKWSVFLTTDRGPGFNFRRCYIFCVVVDLEPCPLILERISEELFE
jgi:hypothetical protein